MPHAPLDLIPFLSSTRILFLGDSISKDQVLEQMASNAAEDHSVTDPEAFRLAIFEREEVSSTGIGKGVAVPHAKLASNNGFSITIGISTSGIDYHASDDQPVHVLFMIAANDTDRREYLRLLATVAATLKCEDTFRQLCNASNSKQILDILAQ